MFPAARVADQVTHDMLAPSGIVSPPGFPTVLIEGMPAARMGDFVVCTGVTSAGPIHPPPPPTPPIPIVTGCPTVLVGYMPLARWTIDVAGCGTFIGLTAMIPSRKVFVGP
jgi:uncharacterized Zn-binding protein involved in type VI secretion